MEFNSVDRKIEKVDKKIENIDKKLAKRTSIIMYEIFERHYDKKTKNLKSKKADLIRDRGLLQEEKLKEELKRGR